MKRTILFMILLIALTGCAKQGMIRTEVIPADIKPAPGAELPEPLPAESDEVVEEIVEVKEEKPEEEHKEEVKTEEEENVVYIEIKKFEFVPAEIKIAKGTRVIWKNTDDDVHIFKQVGKSFRSPIIKPGMEFELTLKEAEIFKYTDLNYGSRGEIVVE